MRKLELDSEKIIEELKILVCKEKNIKGVSESDDIFDDIGFDSLNLVNFFITIEEKFNIILDESDLNPNKLKTLKAIEAVVEKYLGE